MTQPPTKRRSLVPRIRPNSDSGPPVPASPRLPDITPCAARVAQLIFDARRDALVRRVPDLTECFMSIDDHAPGSESASRFSDPGFITLLRQADSLAVAIDLAAHPALSIVALPVDSTCADDRKLREAIASALLAPLTASLHQAGFTGWEIATLARMHHESPSQPFDAACSISFSVLSNGSQQRAKLAVSDTFLNEVERMLCTIAHAPAGPLASILVPGRMRIGTKHLRISTLRDLVPGDVLLRATAPALAVAGTPFRTSAAWGSPGLTQIHASVEFDGRAAVLLEDPCMKKEVDQPRHDSPDSTAPIDVGSLEVPVVFEIDTLALTVARLATLRAGYVIELSGSLSEMQIRLVTHGQLIGYGELITVGEHLGIRILHMAQDDDSGQ